MESVEAWAAPNAAAGWLRADGGRATIGDTSARFALASVTKLLTATAVLVAAQEEILDLDEAAGPPGSTVRLLLAHASGLPFDGDEPIAAPGARRIYGNPAFVLLGQIVAERAGMAFGTYLEEAVLAPLDMSSTSLDGSAAAGATSTVADMLRFAAELLGPGRVLAPEMLAVATAPQLPDLDGVLPGYGPQRPNLWGLGFEIRGDKSPHWTPASSSPRTFGHFGQSGCFLFVDPAAEVAVTAFSDVAFGDWAVEAWPQLGESALREAAGG